MLEFLLFSVYLAWDLSIDRWAGESDPRVIFRNIVQRPRHKTTGMFFFPIEVKENNKNEPHFHDSIQDWGDFKL